MCPLLNSHDNKDLEATGKGTGGQSQSSREERAKRAGKPAYPWEARPPSMTLTLLLARYR